MAEQPSEMLLAPYRALDLTDEKGILCGRILADLGADVIQIEPPAGSRARRIGPYYQDIPDPQKSLFWFAYAANKRGITLDIETADGQEVFRKLVNTAHFVIESYPPGHMDSLGLGYPALKEINPGIIVTSITPFGQSGPYRDYKASDIVSMAMGGFMHLTGDADRPPLRISYLQAALHGAGYAAIGSMVAHYHRETTGIGQHVDASIHSAVLRTTHNAPAFWLFNKEIIRRAGPYRVGLSTKALQRQTWPCADGFVTFQLQGGNALSRRTIASLLDWAASTGMDDERVRRLRKRDWSDFDMASTNQELFDDMSDVFGRFFMAHTREELYEGAIERKIMLYPVSSPGELLENKQLKARNYWVKVEHPELGATLTYPGAFCGASETPWSLRRRAPLIGEHNLEVYDKELGIPREKLLSLVQAGVI